MQVFTIIAASWLIRSSQVEAADPEAYMTAIEMIRYWGYPAEGFDVITKDGYVLELFRIPHGKMSDANSSCHRPAVLMVHALSVSAAEYLVNPPESSPAFFLADQGFDIFLLNHRGSTYGRRHETLSPSFGSEFWKYSVDEFANYDAPAVIDAVLEVSGEPSLSWVGNSQGTLVGFMMLADNPAYNSKVKALHQVGPVGAAHNMKGLTRLALLVYRNLKSLADWYRFSIGSHEVAPQWPGFYRSLGSICTSLGILGQEICDDLASFIVGPVAKTFNLSRLPVYLSHVPAGTSTWNMLHLAQQRSLYDVIAQIATRGRIEHMDHNPEENMRRYGQTTPPPYNYSNIDVPVYLYWGENDWATPPEDIAQYLLPNIRQDRLKGGLEVAGYNHFDFAIATDNAARVWKPMAEIMRSQESGMCAR